MINLLRYAVVTRLPDGRLEPGSGSYDAKMSLAEARSCIEMHMRLIYGDGAKVVRFLPVPSSPDVN